jgi:hypothetical protein
MNTRTPPERNQQFKESLQRCLLSIVRELKQDGTVNMSRDNLFQVSVRCFSQLPSAPCGSNCASIARQAFEQVVNETAALNQFTN